MASGTFSTIYWPIETKVRELDACLLFSAAAAQRGWSVIVGGKTEIVRRLRQNAEPGIIVDKSIQKRSERLFSEFKKNGHRVFSREEEAMAYSTPEDYCHRKTGKEAFREVDGVLAWGRDQANVFSQVYPEFSAKVVVTGNVRFDLTSPEVRGIYRREALRLRREWGDFYLLNTRFTKINIIKRGPGYIKGHIAKGHAPTKDQVQLITKLVELDTALFSHFVEFVERFAKELPDKKLIIRPHPAEILSTWEAIAAGKANVHVVRQGSVHPWLLASKLSISNGCTTAVEAFLLDKPGINFRPVKDDDAEFELPKTAAYQIDSTDALLHALALSDPHQALSLPSAPAEEIVGRYIAQYRGTRATQVILDYFGGFYAPRQGRDEPGYSPMGKPNLMFVARQRLKVFVAWCISKDNRARHRVRALKLRRLDCGEVSERLGEICRTLGYEGVRVTEVATNIIQVDGCRN